MPLGISGTFNCPLPGNGGWCLGGLSIQLTATGTQGREVIISGTLNGEPFADDAASLSLPIASEGYGTVDYRVDSESGSSASGTASYALDATTPQISGSLSGAGGMNGWYVSEVEYSATAADTLTGIAAFEISVDGGGYQSYSPVTLSDGIHTVTVRAYDGAGNRAESSQTVNVDTLTPLLDVSVSGAAGENGWYVSQTEVTALADDPSTPFGSGQAGSGITAFEVSLDGGGWSVVNGPLSLSDGIHNLQFRARDRAGNVTEASQEVKVDTITPALSVSVDGTKGLDGWYTSVVRVLAASSDAGSGIATVEAAVDGRAWSTVNGPLSFSDGPHSWQFRVKDRAGRTTETPVQNIKVDTIPPFIEMAGELSLGETLYYELSDPSTSSGQAGSGLSGYRAVIEDDAEKYKKISWMDALSGNKVQGEILWDGKFKDGVKAGVGEYYITLKISDAAGNEAMDAAVVRVDLLDLFQELPAFVAPENNAVTSNALPSEAAPSEQTFGNTNEGAAAEKTTSSTSVGGLRVVGKAVSVQAWTKESETAPPPISTSNILWGAAATALVGATLADWQRKREEDKARREAARAERQANGPGTYRQAAMDYQRAVDNFEAMLIANEVDPEVASQLRSNARNAGTIPVIGVIPAKETLNTFSSGATPNPTVTLNGVPISSATGLPVPPVTTASTLNDIAPGGFYSTAMQESISAALQQAQEEGMMAYYQGRKAGEVTVTLQEEEEKLWWESFVDAGKGLLGSVLSLAGNTSGGSKLATPLYQDPEPPDEDKSLWEKLMEWWNKPWPWEKQQSTPVPTLDPNKLAQLLAQTMVAQTQTAMPTSTPTATKTHFPTITFTPTIAPTISLNGRPLDLKQWTDQAGRTTVEFCGAVLQREAHEAWQVDHWFDNSYWNGKTLGDPGKIFTEAAVRWYWSWIKDSQIITLPPDKGGYGHNPDNPADRELMIYNWIVKGMQSEDNIDQKLLNQYFDELNPNFTQVCNQILYSPNPDWAKGDNMQSWANAYLYIPAGQKLAAQDHLYQYGSGNTAWYILDGPTVARLEPYKIKDGPEYPTEDGEDKNDD